MTTRIWALGTAVAVVAIFALSWVLGISPLLAAATESEAQRSTVDASNTAQEALLAQMKENFSQIDDLEREVDGLRLSMPNEVDSDFLYAYLWDIQVASGAFVETLVTGPAQPYGVPTGDAAAAPVPTATDPAAPADSGTPTVPSVEGLYTVPVTITFINGTPAANMVAFAGLMQHGDRVLLVTNIKREVNQETAGTITAYMFVVSQPDESPGSTDGEYGDWRAKVRFDVPIWGSQGGADPTPTPTPSEDAVEDAEPEEAPSPAPTGTPTP